MFKKPTINGLIVDTEAFPSLEEGIQHSSLLPKEKRKLSGMLRNRFKKAAKKHNKESIFYIIEKVIFNFQHAPSDELKESPSHQRSIRNAIKLAMFLSEKEKENKKVEKLLYKLFDLSEDLTPNVPTSSAKFFKL